MPKIFILATSYDYCFAIIVVEEESGDRKYYSYNVRKKPDNIEDTYTKNTFKWLGESEFFSMSMNDYNSGEVPKKAFKDLKKVWKWLVEKKIKFLRHGERIIEKRERILGKIRREEKIIKVNQRLLKNEQVGYGYGFIGDLYQKIKFYTKAIENYKFAIKAYQKEEGDISKKSIKKLEKKLRKITV